METLRQNTAALAMEWAQYRQTEPTRYRGGESWDTIGTGQSGHWPERNRGKCRKEKEKDTELQGSVNREFSETVAVLQEIRSSIFEYS